jgi:2-hydroxy-6-oxonona-2,4-dienedioate hydrolase
VDRYGSGQDVRPRRPQPTGSRFSERRAGARHGGLEPIHGAEAERLAPLCNVYAIDLPGYGKSVKPARILRLSELADALAGWMQAAGLEKAHLVGNSFGCQIIAEFALRHPARVDRVVLQGPTVDPAARSLGRQFLRLAHNSWRERRSLGLISIRDYWAAGLRRVCATINMTLQDRIEDKLPHIHALTLVVRGTRDPLVPHEWAKRVTQLLPPVNSRRFPARLTRSITPPPTHSWT